MIPRPTGFKEATALWQIVVGFMLLWLPSAVALMLQRQLGLDGLVLAAGYSLGLSVLSIVCVLVFFEDTRRICLAAPGGLRTKTSQIYILCPVFVNLMLAGLLVALYKLQIAPASIKPDVGWAHYFSLPLDRRPDFLLHYLGLTAINTIVVGPLAEELFHIGIIVGVLRRFNFPWPWVFAFDALLFVILHQSHGGGFIGVVPMLGFGAGRLFLDYLFYRTGNIAVPVVGHILHNLRVVSMNWFPLLP